MTSANRKDEEWAAAWKDELKENKRRVGPVHGEPQCFVCAERRAPGCFGGTPCKPSVIDTRCEIFCGEHCERSFSATATAIQSSDYDRAQDGRRRR